MRKDIMGVGFDDFTLDEALECAEGIIDRNECGYVVTPNPEIVWHSRSDEELKEALNSADIVLPDGVGILYSARILKTPLKEKVTGVNFAFGLMQKLSEKEGSVYLLGARPGVAEIASEKLKDKYKGLKIVGVCDGYFKDDTPVIEAINAAKPDFLIVCLGFPRQEKWMMQNRGKLDVGIMAGLGGVLDVVAGTVRRAPEAWQEKNLEWLYRLLSEPRRIKRQIKIPLFMLAVIMKRLRGEN